MQIKKAVITAGGQGTRLLPSSRYYPKEIFPIGRTPVIDFIIKECVALGIDDIAVVINRDKELLIKYLLDRKRDDVSLNDVNFTFIPQPKEKGTAKAIECCKEFTQNSPFYAIFPDEIIFENYSIINNLFKIYYATKNTVIAVKQVPEKDFNKYGIAEIYTKNNLSFVSTITEKPTIARSNLALCGRYVFDESIFNAIKLVGETNGEYYLTTAINFLANENRVNASDVYEYTHDTGNETSYVLTQLQYQTYSGNQELKNALLDIINNYEKIY